MKRINFLGIPIDVIDDDDIEEAVQAGQEHIYVLIRCEDADPTAGSPDLRRRRIRTVCEGCMAVCWFDPKCYGAVARMRFVLLCFQCAEKKVEKGSANG